MGKNLQICALLDVYGVFLSEKQRTLAEHYYYEDLSLGEIAENEGITRQGVSDFVKRSEAQLFEFEEKLGLSGTAKALKTAAANNDINEILNIIEKL